MATREQTQQAEEAAADAAGCSSRAAARQGFATLAAASCLTAAARAEEAYENTDAAERRGAWANAMDAWVGAALLWDRVAREPLFLDGEASSLRPAAADAAEQARLATADARAAEDAAACGA